MTVVDRFVQAVSHGGKMAKPTLIVVHSAETPLKAGYANSIAVNWFGKSATTSAHFMVDPVETIRMLSDNVVSYAVGPKANGFTLNVEQAGYARFSRADWTTPDGLAQHKRVGALVRELCDTRGIPLRWATDQQIRDAARGIPGGICFHNDIHRVLGGTTHTDPTPHYPGDLMMAAAVGGAPIAPTPQEEDDDMPQAFPFQVAPGSGPVTVVIPPVGAFGKPSGAAKWGPAWLTMGTDRGGEAGGPVNARVMIHNGDTDTWRPAFGGKETTVFALGRFGTLPLSPGDNAIVISQYDGPLSGNVEYAKA